MSDTSHGPGWWLASDGKWYPPEQPSGTAHSEPAPGPKTDDARAWWKKPVPLWALLATGTVALLLGVGLGAADPEDTAASEAESTNTTESTDSQDETDEPERTTTTRPARSSTTTTTRPTTTTTTVATTTTTTAPPRPGFGGGTQIVGTDMQPGLYIARDVSGCYWERLSGVSGEFDDILANDNASGQALVEIAASDVAFNSQRCGRWELYEAPAAPADTFGEGDWVVGEQIQPGRYRANVDSSCYWERASRFTHTFGDITANDNVSEDSAIVEISPNDRRFTSSGCGTWSRV